MNDEPKQRNSKKLKIVILVLVAINIIIALYAYNFIFNQSSFSKIPISMTEPSLEKKCHDLLTELEALSQRLAPMEPTDISYSDIQYFKSLEMEWEKSGCQ